MELRHYLRIIGIHKNLILLMCLSALVTSILITYIISEKYRATTLVLIQPTENFEMTSAGKELLGFPFPITYNDPIKTINQTYSDLIKSRPIIERVVRELGLQQEREEYEPNFFKRTWKKSKKETKALLDKARLLLMYGRIEESGPWEKEVTKVSKGLSVSPVKDTYLFEIECEFTEPRVAAAIANTAARIFVEYNRDASTKKAREFKEFVKEQKDISEKELNQLRETLKQFKNQNNIALLNKEAELKLSSLTDFEDSIKKADNSLKEVAASTEKIREQLSGEEIYLRSSTTVSNNPHVQELQSRLSTLEVERAGLLQKFSPEHREVEAVQAKIDEVNSELRQEIARIVTNETTILNPVHEDLRKELMALESQRNSLMARKGALLSVVEGYRADIQSVAGKEKRLSDLELRLRAAENNFLHLSQEYEDMRLNEAEKASEIRVAQEAIPPLYPARPLKILYAGTSLLFSLLAGVCIAFIMEYANVSIRNAEEAEQALNLSLLVSIPEVESSGSGILPLLESPATQGIMGAESRKGNS
jgi:succinoglycan biosynthesis transport protein ExoP